MHAYVRTYIHNTYISTETYTVPTYICIYLSTQPYTYKHSHLVTFSLVTNKNILLTPKGLDNINKGGKIEIGLNTWNDLNREKVKVKP